LLAQVVHGFALGARTHHAYVFANWRADRLKVLMFNVFGMWLCTRRLQSGSFAWPREDTGSLVLQP
jgi:transposase